MDLRITKRIPQRLMRIGTWNVRTLAVPGASKILSKELNKYKMDLVALQETRWPLAGKINTKEYLIYYSGCEEDRYYKGVGLAVNKKIVSLVIYFQVIYVREAVNARTRNIRIKGKFKNLSVITFYAPTEDADEEEKNNFYEMLENEVNKLPNYDLKIVLGDANAKIGKEVIWQDIAGRESLHTTSNNNGETLQFCRGK